MEMGLAHDQFLLVQAGTKTIEIRLNDQKRPQLEVGDQIVFEDLATQQQVTKKVTQLEKFGTFSSFISNIRVRRGKCTNRFRG